MGPKIIAVIDAGPLIHLAEIGALKALEAFSLITPGGVVEEVRSFPGGIKVVDNYDKNLVSALQNEFSLGLGESQCIALAKAEKIVIFLTDDLDARTTALSLGLEPHGTIGILLKAFKLGLLGKKDAIEFVKRLKSSSSLYITSELVGYILQKIETEK
ncbi:MAG TPA: nucleic acid-binding protein [archaeon]|nr:nucleic acid-binding protein [archaeon]